LFAFKVLLKRNSLHPVCYAAVFFLVFVGNIQHVDFVFMSCWVILHGMSRNKKKTEIFPPSQSFCWTAAGSIGIFTPLKQIISALELDRRQATFSCYLNKLDELTQMQQSDLSSFYSLN